MSFMPSLIAPCHDVFGWYPWEAFSFLNGNRVSVDLGERILGRVLEGVELGKAVYLLQVHLLS